MQQQILKLRNIVQTIYHFKVTWLLKIQLLSPCTKLFYFICEKSICQHFKTENIFTLPHIKKRLCSFKIKISFFQFHSNSLILLVRSKVRHSSCSISPTKISKLKSLTTKNAKVGSVSQLR